MKKINGSNPLDTYEIATGQDPAEDELAVINSAGKIVEADDVTGVKTVGFIAALDSDGEAIVEIGIILRSNSSIAPLARTDRGAKVFVEDGVTVAKTGTVIAGTLIDVTAEGVFVDVSPVAMKDITAPAAHIADVADVTQDTLVDSSGGTGGVTFGSSILTGSLTGTVNGALIDIAATAAGCSGGTGPSATDVDWAIGHAVGSIVTGTNEQLKELLTASIALTNSVAIIAAQLAKVRTDNAAQVAKINAILARMEAAGVSLTA